MGRTFWKTFLGAALFAAAIASPAKAETTINVLYVAPDVWGNVHEDIKKQFEALHPDIKIVYNSQYKDFETALQGIFRGAITGQLPDVTYIGYNRIRALSDRGLAVDLAPFIKAEKDWDKLGHDESLMSLGQVQGKQYGLAWAISTPVIFYNADLVKKAGVDPANFPKTWDGVFELARKIENPEAKIRGMKLDWDITGNWMWQALVFSYGGAMMTPDEKKVAFDGETGQKAMSILVRSVTEGKMKDTNLGTTQQDFALGRLGMWVHPTSRTGQIIRQSQGKFELRSAPFPLNAGDKSRIPAGGSGMLMMTKDAAKQKAAWEYMKFASGPIGTSIMVKATGYIPGNSLPGKDPALLKEFFDNNVNLKVSLGQLPVLTGWYAFPGENGLKITDVINDHLQTVVNQSVPPDVALKKMTAEVQNLLPK